MEENKEKTTPSNEGGPIESQFESYRRKSFSEMRPVVTGETVSSLEEQGVSISKEDLDAGSPKIGDLIARNPKNHKDMWLVAKAYAEDNLEQMKKVSTGTGKTLNNTTADKASEQVSDIDFWGNGDTFKLISKASSKKEGWMKSTKAMEIFGVGCVVQVTTQQGNNVAEAVTFVPGAKLKETKNQEGEVISRYLSNK